MNRAAAANPGTEHRIASAAFLILFVAPLTVYLGAPPIVNQGTALEECEQLAETRLTGSSETVDVRWTRLPRAQWECIVDGDVVADLGWYATPSTDSTAVLR